jgi:hypothetical protein
MENSPDSVACVVLEIEAKRALTAVFDRVLGSRRLGRQVGEVFEQHAVDEDVATTHFLKENQLGAVVEELNKLKWRISI